MQLEANVVDFKLHRLEYGSLDRIVKTKKATTFIGGGPLERWIYEFICSRLILDLRCFYFPKI